MSTRFPHLTNNESEFPHLQNVDVYKFDNEFDYERYNYAQMKIQICCVPWDMGEARIGNQVISGIGNVVDFGSPAARDEWLANIPDSDCFRYVTKYRQLHRENKIDVDIPYDVAANFNYVAVEYFGMANEDSPIEHESDSGRRKWFWFIREVEFISPNTTRLHIMSDAWQTFSYDIDVTSMVLERGHAPLFDTDADTFLANPIANNSGLLTDDVNFGGDSVIKDVSYMPIGNGFKYVLFALPLTKAALLAANSASSVSSSAPTYSDTSARWGYQLQVNNYEWGYIKDYSNGVLNISALANTDDVFNGCLAFAIPSDDANGFFAALALNYAHVLNAIQGVYVVASDMLSLDSGFSFNGYTIYQAHKANKEVAIDLNKSMFGFSSKYANLAKLYTYPYSVLEFTDDEGFSIEVRVENTGSNLAIRKEISIAYPFIEYRSFLIGANGTGSQTYTWRNLANSASETMTLWEDDFSKYMARWDIPTYALYANAKDVEAPNAYADMQARRETAITTYENTARSANTGYENSEDSLDTQNGNVYRSANATIANQTTQNTANTAITGTSADASTAITAQNASTNSSICATNNNKINNDAAEDNRLSFAITTGDNAAMAATTALNNAASVQLTGINNIQNVAGAIGSVASLDIGGAVSSGISAYTSVAANGIQTATASASCAIQMGVGFTQTLVTALTNIGKATIATATNSSVTSDTNTAAINNTATSNGAMISNTATGNAAAAEITGRSAQAMKDNSDDTTTTETANADYNRDASIAGAKANLVLAQIQEKSRWDSRKIAKPSVICSYAGNALPDAFKRRGVRLNVRTQPKAAIECAGDEFLRYGYMYDRQYEFDGKWQRGKHFTYWKLRDFWISNINIPDMYVDRIRFFLLGGVTIWDKPESIGHVSIYDNGI